MSASISAARAVETVRESFIWADGQFVNAGSILYRQRGTKVYPGINVMRGGDDTLFTTVSGIVKFERVGKDKKRVSCYPVAE